MICFSWLVRMYFLIVFLPNGDCSRGYLSLTVVD
jgi:hypothetical protein